MGGVPILIVLGFIVSGIGELVLHNHFVSGVGGLMILIGLFKGGG